MASITNKIIANIKKSSLSNDTNYINTNNVVCIDTSNNRIGINTKNPLYSIDISGSDTHHAINVYDLYIRNVADINEISCNNMKVQSFSGDNLEINDSLTISAGFFNTLSGNIIECNTIITNDVSISELEVPKIKSNDISANIIDVSIVTIYEALNLQNNVEMTLTRLFAQDISSTNEISGNKIYAREINVNEISANEISCNNLFVDGSATFLSSAFFNNLTASGKIDTSNIFVDGSMSVNNLIVDGSANFQDISCNILNVTNQINIPGDFKSDINNNNITTEIININNICNINNNAELKINLSNGKLINNGTTYLKNGTLILPVNEVNDLDKNNIGNIYLDTNENTVNIRTDESHNPKKIQLDIIYATIELDNEISGNDISINNDITTTITNNKFFIENSNNLLDQTTNNYKYIPIKTIIMNNITIIDSKSIEISNYDSNYDSIFEIHANVSIRYLNRIMHDVEPNNYTFGLYPTPTTNTSLTQIDPYVSIKNSIIVFDNSFNYANSSLSYIGKIKQNNNIKNDRRLTFYISSEKDINYLVINSFNCTIRQLA